ncbi:hypothetical protein [Kitasatospora cinereorecta]|uniref:Asp23/Gls24 family envelope stress response protein n=1 Tax=Kitasatospora cinereorecta TaxID=285560 RepID=A0ABW0VSL6_9ACTN
MTEPVALPAPAGRGRLRIADPVYARIAAQAAREALADAWAERPQHGPLPRVSVLVVRGRVRLTLHLDLPYPVDTAALAVRARDAAIERVIALTGTPVGDVTVIVDRLVPAGAVR